MNAFNSRFGTPADDGIFTMVCRWSDVASMILDPTRVKTLLPNDTPNANYLLGCYYPSTGTTYRDNDPVILEAVHNTSLMTVRSAEIVPSELRLTASETPAFESIPAILPFKAILAGTDNFEVTIRADYGLAYAHVKIAKDNQTPHSFSAQLAKDPQNFIFRLVEAKRSFNALTYFHIAGNDSPEYDRNNYVPDTAYHVQIGSVADPSGITVVVAEPVNQQCTCAKLVGTAVPNGNGGYTIVFQTIYVMDYSAC